MALITCPECKKKISEFAHGCPNCGYHLTPERVSEIKNKEKRTYKRWAISILWFIVVFSVFYLISLFYSSDTPSPPNRETVYNSEWDGSVSQVESWLEANLKDPHSLEFIEWSPVQKIYDGRFMVRVKYRAKNSFGGYVIENKVFSLDSSGTVVNVADFKF